MAPTIRIDDDVYAWLQKNARPFEDTPNSVLRSLAGLDQKKEEVMFEQQDETNYGKVRGRLGLSGKQLNKKWEVGAKHALFHKDGTWYNNLERFPGALFDPKGYILFKTEEDYHKCPYVTVGRETNIPKGISTIPGYIRKIK